VADNDLQRQEQGAGTAASQEASTPAAQPQADAIPKSSGINIDDFPEGRQLRSTYDKRIAALEREIETERLQRQAAQRAIDEAKMQHMTNEERLELQLQRAQDYIREVEAARERERGEARFKATVDRLVLQSGAPREEIEAADSYQDAVDIALRYATKKAEQEALRAEQREISPADAPRNQVDLGSGRPPEPGDPWEERRLELLKQRDPHAYTMHIMGLTRE